MKAEPTAFCVLDAMQRRTDGRKIDETADRKKHFLSLFSGSIESDQLLSMEIYYADFGLLMLLEMELAPYTFDDSIDPLAWQMCDIKYVKHYFFPLPDGCPRSTRRPPNATSSCFESFCHGLGKKYVLLCWLCGILCLGLAAVYLTVYFLLEANTTSLHYFQTMPTYVPSIPVSN